MNHQPFEDWLLADERPIDILSPQDQIALKTHLATCEHCTSLSEAWRIVEDQLQTSPLVSPKPGFEWRFAERLAQARRRRHRLQTVAIFGFTVFAALALLVVMVVMVWPLLENPKLVLFAAFAELIYIYSLVDTMLLALGNLPGGFSLPTVIATLVLSLWTAGAAVFLWIVTFRFFIQPRSVNP